MRRLVILFTLMVSFLPALPAQTPAPLRGYALYEAWPKLDLAKLDGPSGVQWLPDGSGYLETKAEKDQPAEFYRIETASGLRDPFFNEAARQKLLQAYSAASGKDTKDLPFRSLDFTPDGKGLLFEAGGKEYLYWTGTEELIGLAPPAPGGAWSPGYLQYLYVKDYDLWAFDRKSGSSSQLTRGGSEQVMNGQVDWVYEEELDQSEGFWWSPDGRRVAYLQFDERAVHQQPLVHDLKPDRAPAFAAILEQERYPKAGGVNPVVRILVLDLTTGQTVTLGTGSSPDIYLTRVVWRQDGSEVLFQRLNRFQNKLELLGGNPSTGEVRTILTEEEPCFINLHNDFIQLEDKQRFIWSSERSGWKHLYLYDFSGKLINPLTAGEWEAASVARLDEKNGWLYFQVNNNRGLDRHLGRVRLDGSGLQLLTAESGTHRVSVDPSGQYYCDHYSSLTVPASTRLCRTNGTILRTIATTKLDGMKELGLEEPELVGLKAADGQTDIYGLLFKPAGFDPGRRYPLYVMVYGGPSRSNSNSFQTAGTKARLAQLGFLVWEVDGRGTTGRGKQFLSATYLKFGVVEIDDQAAAVRQLVAARPYIDGKRVGITGGSYGGYATCMALLRHPEVFQAGVASASVTDWQSYDSIYTERYMRTPEANPDGYRDGSALTCAKNLQGRLLLIHGSIDNNVHPGNTLHLADALQKEGKHFELMIYPEHRHGIRGYCRDHATRLRLDYFLRHLQPDGWEEITKAVWAAPPEPPAPAWPRR